MTVEGKPVTIECADGVRLGGHLWPAENRVAEGTLVINAATGVRARYYHYYARFLAEHGFTVLTYDYRGIGASRPASLRGCGFRWSDWGEYDFDAALRFASGEGSGPPVIVGHSIGGFLPGFAQSAFLIDRMLTVGAQYAYWPDYAKSARARLFLKWHVAMPLTTAVLGYFPGSRWGWLEDLPAGVANEWSFRRARMELSYPEEKRAVYLHRFAEVSASILAISMSDDEIATPQAVDRALDYYEACNRTAVRLAPADLGYDQIGHFSLFHSRHAAGFWIDTLLWLRDGVNPWPRNVSSKTRADLEAVV